MLTTTVDLSQEQAINLHESNKSRRTHQIVTASVRSFKKKTWFFFSFYFPSFYFSWSFSLKPQLSCPVQLLLCFWEGPCGFHGSLTCWASLILLKREKGSKCYCMLHYFSFSHLSCVFSYICMLLIFFFFETVLKAFNFSSFQSSAELNIVQTFILTDPEEKGQNHL